MIWCIFIMNQWLVDHTESKQTSRQVSSFARCTLNFNVSTDCKWWMTLNNNNSSTSLCLRSSSCRTDLSIHFQTNRSTTTECFCLVTLTLSPSTFNYETDHITCEITLGGWHCGLRLFKLGSPVHAGLEPRSLAWLACSTDQCRTLVHSYTQRWV